MAGSPTGIGVWIKSLRSLGPRRFRILRRIDRRVDLVPLLPCERAGLSFLRMALQAGLDGPVAATQLAGDRPLGFAQAVQLQDAPVPDRAAGPPLLSGRNAGIALLPTRPVQHVLHRAPAAAHLQGDGALGQTPAVEGLD